MSIEATLSPRTVADAQGRRLESWKEIATYLGRDVTTVRRWERREGLPVHRLLHRASSVRFTPTPRNWTRGGINGRLCQDKRRPRCPLGVRSRATWGSCAKGGFTRGAGVDAGRRSWCGLSTNEPSHPRLLIGGIRSLAVLPLENFSGNPEQDYLSDGMTEALIARLSTIHGLRVISRTSAMQFKGTRKSVPAIGKELSVDAVIEGSVLRVGRQDSCQCAS